MTLSPQFLDELRARTTLSTLIGTTTRLTKAGREYKGCCPFHQEKTPSFYVNDDKGFYHCFGCSAHGDAIRWLTDQRGLPFMDAVKELAAGAGMEVPAPDPRAAERDERARGLREAMEDAQAWFVEQLGGLEGAAARTVLERRGIRPETARAFGLGFSPDSKGRLKAQLKSYGDALLVEAGLLISVEDKEPYDRFRGRLMIPIRDPRGRVIAFGGRVIGDGDASTGSARAAKYLNSPDTPLFDKGRTLFNLDRALPAARKANRVIVVEGYMDVIALAQAGIGEAVAPLGTALTEAQLERLWRIADVPILCFDGDAAGQKAALRAAQRALPLLAPGRSLQFVTLPPGQDPDDLIRARGVAAIEALFNATQPLVERLWQHLLAAEPLDTPEQRAGLKARLAETAHAIQDRNVRDEYAADFRRRYEAAFAPAPRAPWQPRRPGQRWTPPVVQGGDHPSARTISAHGIDPALAKAVIAGLIRHPVEIARHMEVLGSLRAADGALGRLFEAVVDVALEERGALDSPRLVTILAKSGFGDVATELLRPDQMQYSFTQREADPELARADLDEAISILVAAPEVNAALASVNNDEATLSSDAFERQAALVKEKAALEARLANLVQAQHDARAFETEDD